MTVTLQQKPDSKEKGRKKLYPKKPQGKLTNYRNYVSYALLVLLFGTPFVRINGAPMLMINLIDRKFVILGSVFFPQDMYIFVLLLIAFVVFVILFTVVFGRLFCGWICPQTIFMEMVFRKIEYMIEGDYMKQKALDKSEWTNEKIMKKALKHGIFFFISILIANIFLAYIIGTEALFKIISEPIAEHLYGFTSLVVFSGLFYGVFARLREQVCISVCPYGRLQGVMMDSKTVVVTYDSVRGEPRGKMRKNETRTFGDCIDCMQCVQVCPTGIDIRNGTQLECTNCTACIDACNDIMLKINKPEGLIRYDSKEGIEQRKPFRFFTTRTMAYSAVLLILMAIIGVTLFTRNMTDTTIMRAQGTIYQKLDNGNISNLYNARILNKSHYAFPVSLRLLHPEQGTLHIVGNELKVIPEGQAEGVIFVELSPAAIEGMNFKIRIGVFKGNELIETVTTKFVAPVK